VHKLVQTQLNQNRPLDLQCMERSRHMFGDVRRATALSYWDVVGRLSALFEPALFEPNSSPIPGTQPNASPSKQRPACFPRRSAATRILPQRHYGPTGGYYCKHESSLANKLLACFIHVSTLTYFTPEHGHFMIQKLFSPFSFFPQHH